ncbi:hypothetical protein KCP78_13160 [Salmonella enterica subsp. enterica]|nr:hypothetical protein KCP78_13160 [Salmonella enterica subsp. enterica]
MARLVALQVFSFTPSGASCEAYFAIISKLGHEENQHRHQWAFNFFGAGNASSPSAILNVGVASGLGALTVFNFQCAKTDDRLRCSKVFVRDNWRHKHAIFILLHLLTVLPCIS